MALVGRRRRRSPAAFVYVDETSPPWYERIRYPLRYSRVVRVHARRARSRPGAARRRDLPGVEVPAATRESSSGAIGLMQLTPVDGAGDRDPHAAAPRFSTSDLYEPGDQHPLRRVVPRRTCSRSTAASARARRLQRGPGERRPLARERPGDPVRRDARVRQARRAPEADLPRAWRAKLYPAAE